MKLEEVEKLVSKGKDLTMHISGMPAKAAVRKDGWNFLRDNHAIKDASLANFHWRGQNRTIGKVVVSKEMVISMFGLARMTSFILWLTKGAMLGSIAL